ncbi:MAG TPA: YbhB/YbcL family Raf kinase inhibitor-like protein [Gemmatimonadales bacterium]|nr:YbhB/YbcL family Raf kinase inhibitor-like protein [Gemmatimonadales bacterium]
MSLTITSSAFSNGGAIPARHTCEGADQSPPLAWSGVPAAARSVVLIVDDPDAPDPAAPQRIWVHWVLYNLPPSVTGLPEAVARKALPPGTLEGVTDFGRTGWGGPCPPIGRHRYFFRLYALDRLLDGTARQTRAAVDRAMAGHIIAQAELMGTYEKHKR